MMHAAVLAAVIETCLRRNVPTGGKRPPGVSRAALEDAVLTLHYDADRLLMIAQRFETAAREIAEGVPRDIAQQIARAALGLPPGRGDEE